MLRRLSLHGGRPPQQFEQQDGEEGTAYGPQDHLWGQRPHEQHDRGADDGDADPDVAAGSVEERAEPAGAGPGLLCCHTEVFCRINGQASDRDGPAERTGEVADGREGDASCADGERRGVEQGHQAS